jgi:hypothetical protein
LCRRNSQRLAVPWLLSDNSQQGFKYLNLLWKLSREIQHNSQQKKYRPGTARNSQHIVLLGRSRFVDVPREGCLETDHAHVACTPVAAGKVNLP